LHNAGLAFLRGFPVPRERKTKTHLSQIDVAKGETIMCDKTYNGWPNYETWAVNLWLENDYGTYHFVLDTIRENGWYQETDDDDRPWYSDGVIALGHWLKDWHEEMNPIIDQASVFTDLLGAAFQEVDWYYIADHWIDNNTFEEDDDA
jgi:hypothetical protein